MASTQETTVLPGMPLRWGNVADTAVAMFVIVPLHQTPAPRSGSVQISKSLEWKFWPILGGTKQRFGEGVVVADPWARIGWLDAEPVQHGQNHCRLQGGAVVAV